MPNMTFSNPSGQQITVNSPDGSTPSEGELDQLFAQAHGSKDDDNAQEEPEKFSDIESQPAQQTQQNNISGNVMQDITGDIVRGALNSGAGTLDKINGAVKLLKNVTSVDLNSEGLTNVSNKLKQLASQQPQSANPIVSGIGQFVGSVPDALAEFAGSGGGIGFIARSAALQAAQDYNKTQSPTDLLKGGIEGGTIGAVLDKAPNIIEGAAQVAKKWGMTGGKTYLQAVTGATDEQAQEMIDKMQNDPSFDINPKSKVEDYDTAKKETNEQLSTLKDNNSNLVFQEKEKYNQQYNDAKLSSDDAVNNLVENNRDTIDDLRSNQNQKKEDLTNATSVNMMAATDAATQRLADATTQTTASIVKAKNALENTLVSTFDTASKKIDTLTKGATDDVVNAHATLEKNNLDYVPTSIIKKEVDSAIGSGNEKYFKTLSQKSNNIDTLGAEKYLNKEVSPGVKVSDLPKEAQEQYRQQALKQGQVNLGQLAKSGNTQESLVAQAGTRTNAVTKAISLINETKEGLVNEFSGIGKTSLAAIEAHSNSLEGAIDKGFNGQAVPKGLVAVMAKIKQAINPTKLYEKYPKELSHLEPLANANKGYSTQIDGLRNALNLYKDNVDGTVNPQKVFNALDKNDSGYLAKLRQADEALPKEDKIFNKVKNAYDNYKTVEASEKKALSSIEENVSKQRLGLNKKFNDMKKQLSVEQRQELLNKIKETRTNKREFSQQESIKLKTLHFNQQKALDIIKAQKDKELGMLQDSINKRLNSLHLLHMARGMRASASGTAKIFQNVGNYRSIDGLTTMNPLKMAQGSLISKFASPIGASNIVKDALKAPENVQGIKKIVGNEVLKRLLATKISGRRFL